MPPLARTFTFFPRMNPIDNSTRPMGTGSTATSVEAGTSVSVTVDGMVSVVFAGLVVKYAPQIGTWLGLG